MEGVNTSQCGQICQITFGCSLATIAFKSKEGVNTTYTCRHPYTKRP